MYCTTSKMSPAAAVFNRYDPDGTFLQIKYGTVEQLREAWDYAVAEPLVKPEPGTNGTIPRRGFQQFRPGW